MAYYNRGGQNALAQLNTALTKPDRLIYTREDQLRKQVNALLTNIPTLKLKRETFFDNRGVSTTMLQLKGTIAIMHRGATYNIPILIWLPLKFPMEPPKPYVTPTATMIIKKGHRHVDMNGVVYLPYLNQWNNARSNLAELVMRMQAVFGPDPPLYAVSSGQQRPPPPVYQPQRPPHAATNPYPGASLNRPQQPAQSQSWQPGSRSYQTGRPAASQPPPSYVSNDNASREKAAKEKAIDAVVTKTHSVLQEELTKTEGQIKELMNNRTKVDTRSRNMVETKDRLKQQLEQLRDAKQKMETQIGEKQKWLEENEAKDKVDPDEAVKGADALAQQMMDALASDMACEDTLYELKSAFQQGRLDDLNRYLRQVRNLASKQFMSKALCEKIENKQNPNVGRRRQFAVVRSQA